MERTKLFGLLALFLALVQGTALGASVTKKLQGHISDAAISSAQLLGRNDSSSAMQLAVVLSPKDPQALQSFLQKLYDPSDAEYHHFLTTAQFTANFAPSQNDVNCVVTFFESQGLTVSRIHENNLVIDVQGTSAAVEAALQVQVNKYQASDGRVVASVASEPVLPSDVADKIVGIGGLDGFAQQAPHYKELKPTAGPTAQASGMTSSLTPSQIKTAYNLGGVAANGAGETIALFELDGYQASDISGYASYYSLSAPKMKNVLVDGASGAAGSSAAEVTLDIELVMALAPGAANILVYEGPNSGSGIIDTYSKIATDNSAREISSSWASAESQTSASMRNSENTILQQMAAQGQTIFVASGDSGAFSAGGSSVDVEDPASQPYITAVGGTTLNLNSDYSYGSESTWSGSGGGVSKVWTQPSWQAGLANKTNGGSSTMRMVPDVALDSNPSTGYSIYYQGGLHVYGGTSCAAPLWAGFAALVNQTRASIGLAPLGFINPRIYALGNGSLASTTFHDVTSGTNQYYSASSGYDLSTGWGSFNGVGLYASLSTDATSGVAPPGAPSNLNIEVVTS